MATKRKSCSVAVSDDGRIYGAGSSPRAAMKMAAKWTENTRGLETFPATAALCSFVKSEGYVEHRVSSPSGSGRKKYGLKRRSR